jgi:hypothetical protein
MVDETTMAGTVKTLAKDVVQSEVKLIGWHQQAHIRGVVQDVGIGRAVNQAHQMLGIKEILFILAQRVLAGNIAFDWLATIEKM